MHGWKLPKLELQIEQNKSENHPITSISVIATFRIRGDFSPPPLPYPDLGEMSGAGIVFLQGTNISDAIPSISLARSGCGQHFHFESYSKQ
jgi:hypothetical protein